MVKFIQMLVVCLMLVCASGATRAGDYEDGLAAVHRGDYATALKLLIPLAQKRHAWAQYNLGVMYDQGEGVAPDDKEAVKWYRLAADQGIAQAEFNLGHMYYEGHGVAQDYKEAMKWYRLAADQGLAQAQSNLGVMYAQGQGVAQDYVRAHMWMNLGAASLSGDKTGDATSNRELVSKNMTSAQIAQAQEMARKCQESNFKNCD
jgi:TPR repeat protein